VVILASGIIPNYYKVTLYIMKILLALLNKEDRLLNIVREDMIRIKEENRIKEIIIEGF